MFTNDFLPSSDECRALKFKPALQGYFLQGHVIKIFKVQRERACDSRCFVEDNCVSFNVGSSHEGGACICELSDSDHEMHPEALVRRNGFTYHTYEVSSFSNSFFFFFSSKIEEFVQCCM